MKITIPQLKKIYDTYSGEVHLKVLNDTRVQTHKICSGDILSGEHVDLLARTRLQFIEIIHEPISYQYLNREFPASFRKPYASLSYMDFDRHLELLDRVNLATHRKRSAIIIGDCYAHDIMGKRSLVLGHGEELDYRSWNARKRDVDKKTKISFRNSEVAIIILVNLNMDAGTEYVERFRQNTDLISILVSNRNEYAATIAPDFVPTEDIISVTDPAELLKIYVESRARLIIIGETINESYKKALVEVKKHDKFARMMVVPQINQRNMDHFLREVALVYNADRWEP